MLDASLKASINKLWDRFWAGGIANPLTAIEQISYLIFMKRLEDLDMQHEQRAHAHSDKYESVFKNHENCRWSKWKHYNAEDMLKHVRDEVFPSIKNLKNGESALFAESMKDAVFMIPKASLLQEAVSIIDDMKIAEQNKDTQGDIYEYLLSELKTSGKNGQFRTPRHIIRMMVALVDPQIGQTICDPACGTGGFLINAYEYMLLKNTSPSIIKYDEEGAPHNIIGDRITKKEAWAFLSEKTFHGNDFETVMVRIALMNMILHGIDHPNIRYADSLSKSYDITNKYDVILANPPFTGSIDNSDINDAFKLKTTKTELLFVELFYQLLHSGGKAAVIVPQGVLFGASNAHVEARKLLLENTQLEAVITMPSGVFQPYSGVATAILVFTKGGSTDKVWFYEMKADGYTLDQKRTLINGKGDAPDIIEKFKTKATSEKSFTVSMAELEKNDFNLALSRYKQVKPDAIEHQDPEKLLGRVLALEEEIQTEMKELAKLIKNAKVVK